MSVGTIVALLLAAATAAWVILPMLRKDAVQAERIAAAKSQVRELQAEREMLLASLKDLEDDLATGKMDEQDYEQIKAKLSAQAVRVMRKLDELEKPPAPRAVPRPSSS